MKKIFIPTILLFSLAIPAFLNLKAQSNYIDVFSNYKQLSSKLKKLVKAGNTAVYNSTLADSLIAAQPQTLSLSFQFENKTWLISLEKNNIFSDNFFYNTGSRPKEKISAPATALYYKGHVLGMQHSFAAVSILHDKMVAVIADDDGNINIGAINNADTPGEHIIYRDNALLIQNEFVCATNDAGIATNNLIGATAQQLAPTAATINSEPVDVYFEADNRTFLNNGSNVTNTFNYVTALFNMVKVMYENDSVNVQISSIKIWDTPDPYVALTTSSNVLSGFSANMAIGFPGDISHFLSQRSLGGGVAYLNAICNSNSVKTAVSGNLSNSFGAFPIYSWSVMVITHEMGHNLGSPHTQSCSWPGGAIDNCYATEGGCPLGPAPTNGGTVMSYCHLNSTGINLINGFGPLPGQKIRDILRNNPCLNPAVYFETTSQSVNEENADVENGCADYKIYNTKLKIPYAPSQPVSITVVPSGSAGLIIGSNGDVEVSPLIFTLDAANLSKTISMKVFNDAEIETNETLSLDYNVNANGGNAIKRNLSFRSQLIISNEDHKPDSTVNQPLFYEPFDGIVNGLGSWTQTVAYGAASPNRWQIANSGDPEFSSKAAYISNNAVSLAYSGTTANDSTIVRLESPTINATGFSAMRLNYLYKCNGEAEFVNGSIGSQGAFSYRDYLRVLLSIDNGNSWSIIKDNITGRFQKGLEDIALPTFANNVANLKIAFEWLNNATVVNNPPVIIDSVVVKGTAPCAIQSLNDAANVDEENLGPNKTIHFYNPVTKNIMASIENLSSFDFGCTRVELLRTGTGASAAWGNINENKVTSKAYKITVANSNNSAPYRVKLYYTAAELAGWQAATANSLANVMVVKSSGDITTTTTAGTSIFSSQNNVSDFGNSGNKTFDAVFTGFSTFALMKPYGNPDCPATVTRFGASATGTAYQWQVNTGSGYSNIVPGPIYSNVNTDSLSITNPPKSYFNYKYRCIVTTAFGTVYSPEYVLKFGMKWLGGTSSAWENPQNWSCNTVPDANTDVTIEAGTTFNPELNASTTIRSLTTYNAAVVTIKNGAVLSVAYQ